MNAFHIDKIQLYLSFLLLRQNHQLVKMFIRDIQHIKILLIQNM